MKAIVLNRSLEPMTLEYVEDKAIPEPKDNEIRVKVMAVGLNPIDYKLAEGWGAPGWAVDPVLGLDVAGVVDKLGQDVQDFEIGDRVFYHGSLAEVNGGFAEYACTTAHTVSKLPDNVDYKTAAAIPCAGFTAYQSTIDKLKLEEGKTILIHAGAGGVGGYAIQLAKLKGARVFTTCSPANIEFVKSIGADVAIDYKSENLYDRIMEETSGRGVDYVVDTIDGESATKDIDLLAFSGQVVCVVDLPDFSRVQFFEKGLSIHEIALGGAHLNGDYKAQRRLKEIGDEYAKLLSEGKLHVSKINEIGLKEIPKGLEELKTRHVTGKIVAVI